MPWRFEVYDDASSKARWRLRAANGQTVASAGEAFAGEANAKRAAESFKANAKASNFEVYADGAENYRWRAKAANGQTVASSGEAFQSQSNARRAAGNVQENAGAASGP